MNLDEIIRLELQLDDLFHEVKKVKRKKEQLQIIEERLVNVKNEVREARCEERSLENLAMDYIRPRTFREFFSDFK